jgi:hypothetical protein
MLPGEPFLDRPRDAGEVLDRSALIVRRCWPEFIRIALVAYLPWAIVLNLIPTPWEGAVTEAEFPRSEDVVPWVAIMVACSAFDVLLLRQFARGCLFAFAGGLLRGRRVTRREALGHALRRLPGAAFATLWTGGLIGAVLPLVALAQGADPGFVVLMILGAGLCALAGLAAATGGYVSLAVLHFERRGSVEAFRRSLTLCGKGLGLTCLTAGLVFVLRLLTYVMLEATAEMIGDTIPGLGSVATAIGATVLLLFEAPVELLLYFALRCELENYDLDVMAREVGLLDADEIAAPSESEFAAAFRSEGMPLSPRRPSPAQPEVSEHA